MVGITWKVSLKILVSNDDGVWAQGIRILAEVLADIADVVVMAPDRNRSGASNSLTLANPLRVKALGRDFYSVEGTPTDCVHLALTGFFDFQFDMVISGINEGVNLGDDILYSGTVAAAMEGRSLGLPAIAVSMASDETDNYLTAATIVKDFALKLATHPLPSQTILNINVPNVPLSSILGVQVTRLGTRHHAEAMVPTLDPRGKAIYWVGPPGVEADSGPGTDFFAVRGGWASVTPLHIDMTNYNLFGQLADWTHEFTWS